MIVNSIGVKSPLKTPNYLYGNNSAENSRNLVLGPTFRGGEMQKSISKIQGTSSHKLRTLAFAFLAGAATIFGASTLTSCEKDDPKPPVDNPVAPHTKTSKMMVDMMNFLNLKITKASSKDGVVAQPGDLTQVSLYKESIDTHENLSLYDIKGDTVILHNAYNRPASPNMIWYAFEKFYTNGDTLLQDGYSRHDINDIVGTYVRTRKFFKSGDKISMLQGYKNQNYGYIESYLPDTPNSLLVLHDDLSTSKVKDISIVQK